MYLRRLVAIFVSVLSVGGCGDGGDETTSASGASASSGDATTSSTGSGGGGGSGATGAGGGGGAGGGSSEPQTGEVVLSSGSFSLALASFQRNADLDCTFTDVGACVLSVCTAVSDRISAGVITVKAPAKTVKLTPDAANYYQPGMVSGPLWDPGESIAVEGAGADVPAFSGSVLGPGAVDFTAPDLSGLAKLSVDTSQDLMVSWTGGSIGQVAVALAMQYPTNSTSLTCRFSAGSGQGVVPAAALAMLPKPATSGLLVISVENTSLLTVGGASISLLATVSAQQGNTQGLIPVDLL